MWQTNAIGTKNIIHLQEKYGFRLVHFSSSEVYGDYEGVMLEERNRQVPNQANKRLCYLEMGERKIDHEFAFGPSHGDGRLRLFNTYRLRGKV